MMLFGSLSSQSPTRPCGRVSRMINRISASTISCRPGGAAMEWEPMVMPRSTPRKISDTTETSDPWSEDRTGSEPASQPEEAEVVDA